MTHNGTVHNGLTAEEMLARLLAVDGAGSLLDADTLDALSSASFARSGANTDITSLAGTTTNDNAAAGKVGEVISSNIASGSAVGLTSGATANVTSISLTAGDWDVDANVCFLPNGATTYTSVSGGVHTTSATLPNPPGGGAIFSYNLTFTTGVGQYCPAGSVRISVSETTTVYLVAQSVFAVSTMGAYGYIKARRAR